MYVGIHTYRQTDRQTEITVCPMQMLIDPFPPCWDLVTKVKLGLEKLAVDRAPHATLELPNPRSLPTAAL